MTPEETLQLLRFVAAADRRKIGKTDVSFWHACLDDIGHDDARAAVIEHFRTSTDWLMPAHVRARVAAMRRGRLAQVPLPAPDQEAAADPTRYRESLQASIRDIANGKTTRQALAAPSEREESRPPAAATADLARFRRIGPSRQALTGAELAARQASESRAARRPEEDASDVGPERRTSGQEVA